MVAFETKGHSICSTYRPLDPLHRRPVLQQRHGLSDGLPAAADTAQQNVLSPLPRSRAQHLPHASGFCIRQQ
jgi:hypothetical protein